ncbi:glutathione S-transferase family protein [Acinetobacter sp. S40]|uniref:glutathione S-transferase family protein n=1 Tax=unclassified Acinetobacter TaxID=196816 RepID=UPI00190AA9B1|nr:MULTISPECIES: glutathione S-transferase family protein [unclassified Acinetobacter]MBJ9984677.1 glutathione S-transferase family protein [Acinetobacter sp. S40]MBK0062442.1 glutathione S-transferase family protein [Acinetobacter sp. S55]MBK0066246.1 glutathione S-transferase family protein [Acinetobacter sp. S54]
MITLWGRTNSTNVRKILWCLNELELKFEHIQAGGPFEIVNTTEYLQLNPNGLVPCLQDGDFTLWESHTILRFLAEKYAQKGLFISDIEQRYAAEKWMDWCLGGMSPIFKMIMMHTIKLPLAQRNMSLLQQALQELDVKLNVLNQHLEFRLFIAGEYFSIADIALGSYMYTWKNLPIDQSLKFQAIDLWFERLMERPALQSVLKL